MGLGDSALSLLVNDCILRKIQLFKDGRRCLLASQSIISTNNQLLRERRDTDLISQSFGSGNALTGPGLGS